MPSEPTCAQTCLAAFDFDTILFPFNWVTWHKGKFGPRVLERASEKGMGVLALKTMAKRRWHEGEERRWSKTWYSPVDTYEEAKLAVRFTLSKPVTAAVSPSHAELLWLMCDVAPQLTPLTAEEEAQLAERSKEYGPLFVA